MHACNPPDQGKMTRPSKRARLFTESHTVNYGRIQSSPQRFSLKILVDQLAAIGVPTHEDVALFNLLKSISVAIIQENGIDDWESARNLQRLLLPLLGFLMSSAANASATEIEKGASTVLEVLRCIRNLYQHASSRKSIDPAERIETFHMLLQLMQTQNDDMDEPSSGNKISAIHDQAFEIVGFLLQQDFSISQVLRENRFEIDRLVSALLIRASEKSRQVSVVNVLVVLQDSSSFGPTANSLATFALDILKAPTNLNQMQATTSVHDQLFRWKCILVFDDQITLSHGLQILASLRKLRQFPTKTAFEKDNFRHGILNCLLLLKKQFTIHTDGSIVVKALLKCATHDEVGLDLAFKWLFALLKEHDKGFEHQLDSAASEELVEFLASQAFSRNGLSKTPAAKALVHIIAFKLNVFNKLSHKEQFSFISILSDLMTANIAVSVTEKAIDVVEILTNNETTTEHFASAFQPRLNFALAKAASDEFTSRAVRNAAVRVFWKVVMQDDKSINALSRIPKVLDILVVVASQQEMSAERKIAYSTLMRLSENACNRRILAKQPGLLSCLIRYSRSISREMTHDPTMRDDVKKRILLIATAL